MVGRLTMLIRGRSSRPVMNFIRARLAVATRMFALMQQVDIDWEFLQGRLVPIVLKNGFVGSDAQH